VLWERRIAVVATQHFIRRGDFADTLGVAALLLDDREDLIHKAAGWMLREVAKRDQAAAERFLTEHHRRMPRTRLRYAIERFPEPKRQRYLKGNP
jgi:3-methyladenine DNA glycosylase AlkD